MKKILEMFKQQISVELSDNSINSYCSDVKDFLRRIKKKTNCTDEKIIDKIDSLLVSDVFMDMRTEYTMTTYNRKIVSVNAFCQYICDLGLKNINTCKSIKKYSPKKVRMEMASRPQKETLTIEEVRKIIDTSIIQWSNFKEYRTFLISNEEYLKTREERVNFLKSVGYNEEDFEKEIPITYEEIPDFIWQHVLEKLLKRLEKKEDELLASGFKTFAISGHTEGKKYAPWQMFDKGRYDIKKSKK